MKKTADKRIKINLSEIVEDLDLYPRHSVDRQQIGYMVEAYKSGHTFPPIILDQKNRIVDGVHRYRMFRRVLEPTDEVEVIIRRYRSDAGFWRDAGELNTAHGTNLDPFDRVRYIEIGKKLGMSLDSLAKSLHMTRPKVDDLLIKRKAETKNGQPVVLKRTFSHLAGGRITKQLAEANAKAGGMNPIFYVNQVINIVESGGVDPSNEHLADRLKYLAEVLEKKLSQPAGEHHRGRASHHL